MVLCICEIVPSHLIASWLVWSRKRVYAAFTLPIRPITSSNQFIKAGNGDYSRVSCSNVYTVCVVFFAVASIFFFFFKPLFSRAWYRLDCCPMSAVENLGCQFRYCRRLGANKPCLGPVKSKHTLVGTHRVSQTLVHMLQDGYKASLFLVTCVFTRYFRSLSISTRIRHTVAPSFIVASS